MNLNKGIDHRGIVGGDYFFLYYLRKSKIYLNYYLEQFNIDDYWIYKATRHQKIVSIEEFMDFTYANYVFYKKEKYDKEHIDSWIKYIIDFGGIMFLVKPLPPFSPNKIIIKK